MRFTIGFILGFVVTAMIVLTGFYLADRWFDMEQRELHHLQEAHHE